MEVTHEDVDQAAREYAAGRDYGINCIDWHDGEATAEVSFYGYAREDAIIKLARINGHLVWNAHEDDSRYGS